jgi:hypothetical protein
VSPYEIVDVASWEFAYLETEGKNVNEWLQEPETGTQWMFKRVAENRGGSDWAEKVATEVAYLLRVPAARVELARRETESGIISRDARPAPDWERHGGAVLLEELVPGWDSHCQDGYTLDRIQRVLSNVDPPLGFTGPSAMRAFDVFVGYLVLDAVVANQDRHARNWAVVRGPSTPLRLMASFDHGSSLGYRITDEERSRRLTVQDGVRQWCSRGRATTFEGAPGLVELAARALAMVTPDVADYWLRRVAALKREDLRAIVSKVPTLSEATATFVSEVLVINRGRLLDV